MAFEAANGGSGAPAMRERHAKSDRDRRQSRFSVVARPLNQPSRKAPSPGGGPFAFLPSAQGFPAKRRTGLRKGRAAGPGTAFPRLAEVVPASKRRRCSSPASPPALRRSSRPIGNDAVPPLDGPFVSPDGRAASRLGDHLSARPAERGRGQPIVTHDPDEALALADRTVVAGASRTGSTVSGENSSRSPGRRARRNDAVGETDPPRRGLISDQRSCGGRRARRIAHRGSAP